MAKIRMLTIEEGDLPFTTPAGRSVALKPAETRALVEAGVWASADDPEAWTSEGPDGEVFAGRAAAVPGATCAKIRGKGGRRLGQGRWSLPEGEKRKVVSFALLPSVRQRLAELADERDVSMSMVLEDLIVACGMSTEGRQRLAELAAARGVSPLEVLEDLVRHA